MNPNLVLVHDDGQSQLYTDGDTIVIVRGDEELAVDLPAPSNMGTDRERMRSADRARADRERIGQNLKDWIC